MNVLGDIEDFCFIFQDYSLTQDKVIQKTSSEDLEGSQRLTRRSDVQRRASGQMFKGWASGQFRDEPVVRWSRMGQRSNIQDQIQGDQCEPEKLEESEDEKLDRTAYELGNQDRIM